MRHAPSADIAYIRQLFAPESAAAVAAQAALEQHAPEIAGISIGPEEGKLLQLLIRMNGIKRVVEIGSLAGYSGLWMAEALPDDGEIHLIERDAAHAALIRARLSAKMVLHEGAALDILPTLSGSFDMAFIDADKPNYAHYLDWAEVNVRRGGLIVGDNTLLFGTASSDTPPSGKGAPSKAAWEAMRAFNARLADPQKYCSMLIPTAEGMTVAVKLF
jgi:predicted O-methyltransferase YrrM